MTRKIVLELTDEGFKTLARYVKDYHKNTTVEEYLTNVISFYLRIGSCTAVSCPYGCEHSVIDLVGTTTTLLDWDRRYPDPNTYSTEYICKNCERRFWVRRQFNKGEEYVKDKRTREKET